MASSSGPAPIWPWPSSLDALIAAPKYHTLLLENDNVRVLDVRIPPGETVPLHTHCWPSVTYLVRWANFIRRDDRGNPLLDSRHHDPSQVGSATWTEPYPPHTVENVDTVELQAIVVELKR